MNKFFRHTIAIVAAGAMGLVAACSSSGNTNSTASAGGKIDACKLVSSEQASKILGTKITIHAVDTSAAGPNAASMCNYSGSSIGSGFMLLAGHVGYKDAAKEVAWRKKEAVKHIPPSLPKPSFSDVHGLGDAAYLSKTSSYFQLHVLARGDAIVINRNMAASTKAVDQAKRIAKIALANLK